MAATLDDPPARRRTILVTGFGGFPGSPRNPTERITAALLRHRPRLARLGVTLRCAVLPVRYDGLQDRLHALALAHRPEAWLLLGVAGRRRHLSVETLARNRADPLRPDAAGRCPAPQLQRGGPALVPASLPTRRMLASLRSGNLPAKLSRDAGDYLCNAALYRALASAMAGEVGFLHVPQPRRRASRAPASSASTSHVPRRLAEADLTRAVLLAVLALARPSPRRRLTEAP